MKDLRWKMRGGRKENFELMFEIDFANVHEIMHEVIRIFSKTSI